ncbi:hypothetical protein EW146_g3876 [Bondarzewia mesenterica]|uniref:Uncharacterized protein n=1 Tax=Bondarzewia mesenterica TaxID=1095465 RepID=A0A4S4LWR3_9AGAM|nr:hypothetical protein EW146_g3876 [Bondarzewia mesenterica]
MEPSVTFLDQQTIHDEGGKDKDKKEDSDIYRGKPPPPLQPTKAASISSLSSLSPSSSSSFLASGRLGAIAAVVERAITRWARANWSTSSLSSESSVSTSKSSFRTANKSSSRRRRRRSSVADLTRAEQSEREVVARRRARKERRHVSREFCLYLPQSYTFLQPPSAAGSPLRPDEQRVLRTTSLPPILSQLDAVLKQSTKARRPRHRPRIQKTHTMPLSPAFFPQQDYMLPSIDETTRIPSEPNWYNARKKGKQRDLPNLPRPQQAWWLDVASPTWEDMRAIGKLLHLHPLTLEDILQQEPREKLELFPKLGYSFLVLRAIESQSIHEKFNVFNDRSNDDGHVDEVYVYLVVFREGICSFHFSDISEHIQRVRNKVLATEQTISMSSASWIAHGILDSVVDAFFPFVEEMEEEIVAVENIVFSAGEGQATGEASQQTRNTTLRPDKKRDDEKPAFLLPNIDEKKTSQKDAASVKTSKTHFSLPRPTFALSFRRFKRTVRAFSSSLLSKRDTFTNTPANSMSEILRRMARTKRLVTSLGRALMSKSEVVARLQKRLFTTSDGELVQVGKSGDEVELAMYLGDVQDHIITLQQSLAHYERILSQLHPTYLSNLRLNLSRGRSSSDKAVFILATVSMSVLPPQIFIGLFSTNVTIPTNLPDGPFHLFGIIIVSISVILCLYGCLVWHWWRQSKRKLKKSL